MSRRLVAGALAASMLAAPFAFASPTSAATPPDLPGEFAKHGTGAPVMVAAHRAQWREAPENSLPAIEAAIADGAEIIEIDVKRTKDGVLVLMHDDSINRTTSGTGNVSDLTFAQLAASSLREGLGGGGAAVTDVPIPTLEQALMAVKGRAMINLDKGWPYRDEMYELVVATGTLPLAIFKSTAPVAEVEAFRAKDPAIVYSHVVVDGNAASLNGFGDHPPAAYELIFDRLTDAQAQPAPIAEARETSRIWINTMWKGLAADFTDERSLIDTDDGWQGAIDRFGADTIQTDNVVELGRHLAGQDVTTVQDRRSFRVQAEDYSKLGKDIGYHDTDDSNNGNAVRPYEGVDICDQQGALAVCYTRGGEWLRYDIDIPRAGTYTISGRFAVNASTGAVQLDYENSRSSELVRVRNTTSHDAFEMQALDQDRRIAAGPQSIWLRLQDETIQNFNLDYLQFDRSRPTSHGS